VDDKNQIRQNSILHGFERKSPKGETRFPTTSKAKPAQTGRLPDAQHPFAPRVTRLQSGKCFRI